MIVTDFRPKKGYCSLILESPDDLWIIRRLIRSGDIVIARSSRVIKKEDEFSRPDKGERVKVTVAIEVNDLHLDSSVDRIRIKGTIKEASEESVRKSGTHSISLSPGHGVTIVKEKWESHDFKLINSAKAHQSSFIVVAIDRNEAGIGRLSGSHLSIIANLDSGVEGKMSKEQSIEPFIERVKELVKSSIRADEAIIVAGPGHIKNLLSNAISEEKALKDKVITIEGYDLAGTDGVKGLIKFPAFQKAISNSVVVEVQNIVNEAIARISKSDDNVAYSLKRVRDAANVGAVKVCVVSDDVFTHNVNEEEVVEILNLIESKGGKVYLADSTLELGKQVSSFGGIVAILRYPFKAYQ